MCCSVLLPVRCLSLLLLLEWFNQGNTLSVVNGSKRPWIMIRKTIRDGWNGIAKESIHQSDSSPARYKQEQKNGKLIKGCDFIGPLTLILIEDFIYGEEEDGDLAGWCVPRQSVKEWCVLSRIHLHFISSAYLPLCHFYCDYSFWVLNVHSIVKCPSIIIIIQLLLLLLLVKVFTQGRQFSFLWQSNKNKVGSIFSKLFANHEIPLTFFSKTVA